MLRVLQTLFATLTVTFLLLPIVAILPLAFTSGIFLNYPIEDYSLRWFAEDVDAPVRWEPSGSDFLSPVLTEALLMAEVLPPAEFRPWLSAFLPGAGSPFSPAVVSDWS